MISWKLALLDAALRSFESGRFRQHHAEFETFRVANREWLDDFALFMAIKDLYNLKPWTEWPAPLRDRDSLQMQKARAAYAQEVTRHAFRQFLFFRQWKTLRARAQEVGVTIIGDLPIFVAHDSADVWANRELFDLDEAGHPSVVAGVPPDYFSETGQLWGNPLYRWKVHADTGYAWWLARFRAVFKLVDVVRVDHFRAFVDYWEVPGDAKTAVEGRWLQGPGAPFLQAVVNELGDLPIIAEDLGEINPEVFVLRDQFDLPGMKIIQFAFDDDLENEFLPHHYPRQLHRVHGNARQRHQRRLVGQRQRRRARIRSRVSGHHRRGHLLGFDQGGLEIQSQRCHHSAPGYLEPPDRCPHELPWDFGRQLEMANAHG